MIHFFIESVIHWQGIDAEGRYIQQIFIGNQRDLEVFCKKTHVVLLFKKQLYHLKRKRYKIQLVKLFIRELAILLASELSLTSALQLLQKKQQHTSAGPLLADIEKNMASGKSLSESLNHHSHVFPENIIRLIYAAEKAHQLPTLLKQLSHQQQAAEQLVHQLKKALIYPLSVLFFTLLITTGLLMFVIPQFQALFSNFNAPLPHATQLLITMAVYLKKHYLLLSLCSITVPIFILYGYHTSHTIRRWIQEGLFNLPWLGTLYRLKLLAHWTNLLALTLNAGVRLSEGLVLANHTLTNIALKASCEQARQKINSGYTLHQAFTHTRLFTPSECYLIEMGEATATLPLLLERLSQEAHTMIEYRLSTFSQWIEPAIMLLLAFVAGGLIVTMYLPIFKIGTLL